MEGYLWIPVLLRLLSLVQLGYGQDMDTTTGLKHRSNIRDELHAIMRRHCPAGFFGYRCRFRCRCLGNDECNKVTGTCPRGCAQGFWGPGCQLSNGCYYNGQTRLYMGTISHTMDGMLCQNWSVKQPHDHRYVAGDFPDGQYPENYCRTTADAPKPWCYSLDSRKRWGYCNTINCVCPAGLFGHNCAKMCHCLDATEKCDSILGICKSDCDKGWTGFDCQTPSKCEANTYGWACESQCKCRSDKHCNRFTGPTPECECHEGFFNPPECEPVTKPRIVDFSREKVNPGQPSVFNCTVSAFPTPKASEIRLQVPDGRQVNLIRSIELPNYGYTRMNTFKVAYVHSGEQYKCVVQGVAGATDITTTSAVYELPRLDATPGVVHGSITAHNATVGWRRWNSSEGDPGDPPILYYNVHIRASEDKSYRLAGIQIHAECQRQCRFPLRNLRPNTRYSLYVSVKRDGDGGDGPPGPVIHLTTKCAAPSQAPVIEKLTAGLQHNITQALTRIVVTWKEPDRDTINCNHIVKYVLELTPPPDKGDVRIFELLGHTNGMKTVPDLLPFTEYCASLYFITDGPFRSSLSEKACIVTPQTSRFQSLSDQEQVSSGYLLYQQPFISRYQSDRGRVPHSVGRGVRWLDTGRVESSFERTQRPAIRQSEFTNRQAERSKPKLVEINSKRVHRQNSVEVQSSSGRVHRQNSVEVQSSSGRVQWPHIEQVAFNTGRGHRPISGPTQTSRGHVRLPNFERDESDAVRVSWPEYGRDPGPARRPYLPSAPSNLQLVRKTSTSITISWNRPEPANGNITLYRVMYWQVNSSGASGAEWRSNARYVEYTLTGLKPFSTYQIQVQAVNAAGIGEASIMLTENTEEDVPGKVKNLRNVTRTERTIELEWIPPTSTGGRILHYTVDCEPQKTFLGGNAARYPERSLGAGSVRHTVQELSPATQYLCSVRAHTARGPGPPASVLVWTQAGDPRKPIAPVIKSVTDTTVTLDIHHSGDLTVSFYRLIVERLEAPGSRGRRRRRGPPPHLLHLEVSFNTAERLGLPAYVTAQLDRQKVSGAFTVGDNITYDGYFNGPLQRDTTYDIWLVAFSDVDGMLRESFAKTESPVIVRALTAQPPANHVPVIVGVLVVFILLIVTFAILLLVWRRRHLTSEREKAELPSFGPTILPEPDTSPPPTPISEVTGSTEAEPLLEASSGRAVESEPVYSNVGAGVNIAPIKVEDLWDYIRSNKSNDMEGLKREYRLLPAGLTATCQVARREENKAKNRYGNIIAYDHTRIVLDPEDDDDFTDDYINANYIDGYNKPRAYIAAQGPNTPTIKDLWRMVWKENSKTLIMLTNLTETGKKKCEQYWPDEGCQEYGKISVQLLDIDELPDFTIRTFLLSKSGQSKYLKQFHFTTWPDHGVPRFGHSLLLFRQKIRAYDNLDNGALIIHCSAGVGRTGTYISIDTQLERARAEGIIDVHNFVQLMRTQRVNMVQSFEQYVFVYDSLLEALICGDTTVSSYAFPDVYNDLCLYDTDIGKTKLEEQFEILKLLSTTIERDESTTALLPDNIFKNRCKNIVPANRCRPYLMTPLEGSNDYINAVFLNGYRRKDALLVTQMPLPNTVTDFWRLIYDHNCHTIVMLNDVDDKDETCEQYWTEETCGSSYGPFVVETTAQIRSDPSITVRDFTLTNINTDQDAPRVIRQFHFHRWAEGAAVPASSRAFLELINAVERWCEQTDYQPIATHCMNGASRSGLLCAVLYILERLRKEKEVDVFQAVKQMRLNRTQFIDTMEQYRFCHDILLEYLSNPRSSSLLT